MKKVVCFFPMIPCSSLTALPSSVFLVLTWCSWFTFPPGRKHLLWGKKRNMPKLPEFKTEQEPSLGTEAVLCGVHLKFQNWTPTLSPDLSHLHCSLPQFMASPSFLMLKPKILVISYSPLSLTHDIKSVRKSCWSHLQNIFRI